MSPVKFLLNPYVLLIIATVGWGGNAVAGKMATGGWQPYTLTSLRWLLVAVVVIPFAWRPMMRDREVLRASWPILLALGGCGMAVFNLLMFQALNYTTAINVSIEQASMPIMIILANFFVMKQQVRVLQLAGVAVSIFGVLVTTTSGQPMQFFTNGLNYGDALMLLACVFYAGYTFGLRWRPEVHWLSFMCVIAIGAFLMTVPFAAYELLQGRMSTPTGMDWAVLMYVFLVPSFVSQLAFAKSVGLIGGNRAGLFINLVPVFGSLLAVLVLGERFQWFHALGMMLVIGGIVLAERFTAR